MPTPYTPGPYLKSLRASERERDLEFRREVERDGGGLCPGCGCVTRRKGEWCAVCWPAYEADHWRDERKDRKATRED